MWGNPIVVDNTKQALSHYLFGDGSPVKIGKETEKALLNSIEFKQNHNKIITGLVTSLEGRINIDLTQEVFHIGRTNADYSINCSSDNCIVTYRLFNGDGFWDPDFIDEKYMRDSPYFRPDQLGPNLERFGGTPYPYIPTIIHFPFPNPGY